MILPKEMNETASKVNERHEAVKHVQWRVCVLPFLQVMAGFGAPFVWHVNKAVVPSVTVWSEGVDVNVG